MNWELIVALLVAILPAVIAELGQFLRQGKDLEERVAALEAAHQDLLLRAQRRCSTPGQSKG